MKLNHFLTPHIKINPEWIKDLNVRSETIKVLEEDIGNKFFDTALSNIFLDMSPWTSETKEKDKQMGLCQIKFFFHREGNHKQNKK